VPLVFVHGVNVRRDRDYGAIVEHRDAMFRQFLLQKLPRQWRAVSILNPMWGEDAARFYWNLKCLPEGSEDVLGPEDVSVLESIAMSYAGPLESVAEHPILTTARSGGLVAAIDLLWANAAYIRHGEAADISASLGEAALDFAQSSPYPGWLEEVQDDDQLVGRFRNGLEAWLAQRQRRALATSDVQVEVLGGASAVWDVFSEAVDRIASAIPADASRLLLLLARRPLHKAIATFLGDVLVYLRQRDSQGEQSPIVQQVLAAVDSAHSISKTTGEPLAIIAHSMGGNIVHDVLTRWRADVPVDLLVTVGAQVALFEELKLFLASDLQIPRDGVDRTTAPPAVKTWLNVFDTNDILSFPSSRIFTKVSDYEYSTGKGLFKAHVTYFNRPSFQRALAERILQESLD
jgi:hypothetical protein